MAGRLERVAAGVATIAGAAVLEPYDVRLDALWRHDSVKAALPRQYRAALINEASRRVMSSPEAAQ
jgi:hypothetical protein